MKHELTLDEALRLLALNAMDIIELRSWLKQNTDFEKYAEPDVDQMQRKAFNVEISNVNEILKGGH